MPPSLSSASSINSRSSSESDLHRSPPNLPPPPRPSGRTSLHFQEPAPPPSSSRHLSRPLPALPRDPSRTEEQTFAEFLREDANLQDAPDLSTDDRRRSIMALDRKRRLTGSSTQDGRTRTNNGIFHERNGSGQSMRVALRLDGPSSPQNYPWPRQTESQGSTGLEVIDLTSSPPPAVLPQDRPRAARRTSSSSSRRYVVPKWQPDDEVSECPICKRQFGFLFRRHHCRKCGRVVCNDCSPHRITIPRQFIVNQPGLPVALSRPNSTALPAETVDLTEEDETVDGRTYPSYMSQYHKNSLGGGEKVRLCNPCVPDPQPSPRLEFTGPPTTPLSPGEIWRRNQDLEALDRRGGPTPNVMADWERLREQRRQRGHSMIFPSETGSVNAGRTSRNETSDEGLPSYGTLDSTGLPDFLRNHSQLHRYQNPGDPPIAPPGYAPHDHIFPSRPNLPSGYTGSSLFSDMPRRRPPSMPPLQPHARFPSMDGSARPAIPGGSRHRVRSLLDVDPSHPAFASRSSSSQPMPAGEARPRLRERDICPICHRALPPLGPDGNEIARETHIMECLNSRDPTSQSAPGGRQSFMQSPSRAPIHMLPFVATEKDCLGEDGNVQECSICMVEYDVGDELARLECLCKFHKECIVEWFGRKQECPVHKIA